MKMIQDIIVKPIITEASMDMVADKKYVFKVLKSATKPEIAKAVETLFEGTKIGVILLSAKFSTTFFANVPNFSPRPPYGRALLFSVVP